MPRGKMKKNCEACTAARLEMPASLLLTRSNRPLFPGNCDKQARFFFCELGVVCRTERSIVRKTVSAPVHSVNFFCEVHLVPSLNFKRKTPIERRQMKFSRSRKFVPAPSYFLSRLQALLLYLWKKSSPWPSPFQERQDRQIPLFYFLPPSPFVVKTPGSSSSFSLSTFPTFVVFTPSSFLPPLIPSFHFLKKRKLSPHYLSLPPSKSRPAEKSHFCSQHARSQKYHSHVQNSGFLKVQCATTHFRIEKKREDREI